MTFGTLGPRFERIAASLWFRAAFAILCLAVHLRVAAALGESRFGVPFNTAPSSAPAFANPQTDHDAQYWHRLVVSRWDAGHYIGIALRGYQACPQSSLEGQSLEPYIFTCELAFYPGYPMIGRLASLGGRVPIDYALLGVSLVSSFVFMLLWTSSAITARLGVGKTLLALMLFNAFTTGFTLVGIQTEPIFLALTLGAFVAFERRWYLAGALIAGTTGLIRVSGVATATAFGLALLVATLRDPPRGARAWATRVASLVLPAWGQLALLAFFQRRFGDAFVYFRAHAVLFKRHIGLSVDPEPILRAIDQPIHEMVWLVLCLILFLVGHRDALRRFSAPAQTFLYALVVFAIGIPVYAQLGMGLTGMTRYLLHAWPIFFAMAAIMAKRPALLAFWLVVCVWHYWQVDLCFYEAGPGNLGLIKCNDQHWVGHF